MPINYGGTSHSFAKNAWFALDTCNAMDCDVLGLDWNQSPIDCRKRYGKERVFQGNLDPCYLYAAPKDIIEGTTKMLNDFGPHHIANLGHGLYPDIPLDHVKIYVETVKSHRY